MREKNQASTPDSITSVLNEDRVFPPSKEFALQAHIKSMAEYRRLYKESITDPEAFWGRCAEKELVWFKPWKEVLKWKAPHAKWFVGGKLNVSVNCLDRYLDTPLANKAAIIWEGEPAGPGKIGEERTLTYRQLHREVCLFANVLKRNGIKKGDRVIIYLPMVPEAAVAMLACARIGAVHSVVFGGFSAQSVADRVQDCQAKLVITADGGYRRGAVVPLKRNVDDALHLKDASGKLLAQSIEKVIVLRRADNEVHIEEGRDVWWHRELEYVDANCPAEKMDSEAPFFILYTRGSTGKPKGILHSTAGYLLGAKLTTRYVFDL
ncbi:MAG: AMP-binding protein, partial [Verrucomicrobiota bacterium]